MITPIRKKSVGRALGVASLLTSTRWQAIRSFQPIAHKHNVITSKKYFSSLSAISENDIEYMNMALEHAGKGFGHTFPNPAVGCVLVRQDTQSVLGAGFHPRAGFPHAEVFALLEATGHLPNGPKAAASVVLAHSRKPKEDHSTDIFDAVKRLTEQYASEGGPRELFSGQTFEDIPVVAYVTLEPCCHYGKTPPCAASLVEAKVSRVVVGFRDPNPRVDGGGVRLLEEAGIQVDMMSDSEDEAGIKAYHGCADIVSDFVNRISGDPPDFSTMSGASRRALRSHAGRLKRENAITEVDWTGESVATSRDIDANTDWEALIQSLSMDPTWLETIDRSLWEKELVLLRLGRAAKKKKVVKLLGETIANQLQAHIAQTLGHTVLLYRPGIPPKLDLATLGDKTEN